MVGGATVLFTAGSLIALNHAWYNDHVRTSFHTFNDSKEWLQVDKAGHTWSAYTFSRISGDLWKWTGIDDKKAVLAGSITSLVYLTGIEYLDGHSSKWGWSWSDIAANVTGAGIYASQELLWNEQRIIIKFSSHKGTYDASLAERTNDLFGQSTIERLFKDYNHQAYWLSVNLKSFIPESKIPGWLNIAVGYGAEGMLGGFENKWTDKNNIARERHDIARMRQYYISPDIDLTKINTNSKGLRTLFNILNYIKVPAPALMINSKGKLKAYPLYF
jgi:uncharacterized protein YfiM (DUF2279 family)